MKNSNDTFGNRTRDFQTYSAFGRGTRLKVVSSIHYGIIGIFHCHNPSYRTMALGLTQPLTEMSARNIS